jgi:hypothetical protein
LNDPIQQQQQRHLAQSQREYLRRHQQQQQQAMAQRQRNAALLEKRRRERMLEVQRQEDQRQRILARMEEKKRAQEQLAQQRQRRQQQQTNQSAPTSCSSSDEKCVVVRGLDGNMYRVPSSMATRGRPATTTPQWVRKVSKDESHNLLFDNAQESMSVCSNDDSDYEMAEVEEERPQATHTKPQKVKTHPQSSRKEHRTKTTPTVVVEDASDGESEEDVMRNVNLYVPGPGESWMEPVQYMGFNPKISE